MDNRIFNVNGDGLEMLRAALKLAFLQEGENTTAKAWRFVPEKGFVLLWVHKSGDGSNAFPCPLSADAAVSMVWEWLGGEQAKGMRFEGWDADTDHDGDNSLGWRVFTDDWGHIAGNTYAICAIRPVYLWHGK